MLRDSKRLLRPGGRTAFLTIHFAPGLSRAKRRRAIDNSPPATGGAEDLGGLVAEAGFHAVEVVDVTDAYRTTQRAWIDQWAANVDHLARLFGAEMVQDRQDERHRTLAAIDEGVLRRSLVAAAV